MNSKITIYHNPRCSKSRKTLEIIKRTNIEPNCKFSDKPEYSGSVELPDNKSSWGPTRTL